MKKNIRDRPVDLGGLAIAQPELAEAIAGAPIIELLQRGGDRSFTVEYETGDLTIGPLASGEALKPGAGWLVIRGGSRTGKTR